MDMITRTVKKRIEITLNTILRSDDSIRVVSPTGLLIAEIYRVPCKKLSKIVLDIDERDGLT